MKWIYYLLLFVSVETFAQSDSVQMPNKEYVQMIFHPETKTQNLSYNYSGKWDFDGDGKNDSLYFIGNGGAHTYFYPRLVLSSDGKIQDFQFLEIDMPYYSEDKNLLDSIFFSSQLIIDDFDNDEIVELYLNIDCPDLKLPSELKKRKITSSEILIDFSNKHLVFRNYISAKINSSKVFKD